MMLHKINSVILTARLSSMNFMLSAAKNHSLVSNKGYDLLISVRSVSSQMQNCVEDESFYHSNSGMNDCWLS